jgi:predicted AAA+ superfamily ATPase
LKFIGLKKTMAELSIPSGEIVTWDDEARIDDAISITPAWKWLLKKPLFLKFPG